MFVVIFVSWFQPASKRARVTSTERVVEQAPEENVRESSDADQASGDSCPPLQRRSRPRVELSTEVSPGGQAMDPVVTSSTVMPTQAAPALPSRRSLVLPTSSGEPQSVSIRPTPPSTADIVTTAPISSSTTPPISVPLAQSAPASVSASAPSSSVPVREADLSVDDYPAPSDDNIFFTSERAEPSNATRWENQGDAFVEPFTLADCCQ